MKISIITVCKNSDKTIEETVVSVVGQSYENIEYIVIDGKSEDNTLKVIDKFKENRMKKEYNEITQMDKDIRTDPAKLGRRVT